jgi:hypothetical protein
MFILYCNLNLSQDLNTDSPDKSRIANPPPVGLFTRHANISACMTVQTLQQFDRSINSAASKDGQILLN